jgi:hypothetical protein
MTLSTRLSPLALSIAALAIPALAPAQDDFTQHEIYFELNDTDGDLGIHAAIDGGGWRGLWVRNPADKAILHFRGGGAMARQGLTQLAFESTEPNFDDLAPARFFARFPEGIYTLYARGSEGGVWSAESLVRHVLPAAPANVEVNGQLTAAVCDEEDPDYDEAVIPVVESGEPVTVSWDPVVTHHATLGDVGDVEVQRYEVYVIAEYELGGQEQTTEYAFELDPDTTEVQVPGALLGLTDAFKLEVLVKEREGGNQSAMETCFFVDQP